MFGEVPEWPKGTDCKSVGDSLRRFKSSPPHHSNTGVVWDVGIAGIAQWLELQPSKLNVAGSNPVSRSIYFETEFGVRLK